MTKPTFCQDNYFNYYFRHFPIEKRLKEIKQYYQIELS